MIEELYILINQFGGKTDCVTVFLFAVVFFLFNSLIRSIKLRIIASFLTTLFLSLQLSSLYFTQSFLGYQFYVNINFFDLESLFFLFYKHIIVFVLFNFIINLIFISSHVFFVKLNLIIIRNLNFNKLKHLILIIISSLILIIITKGSFISDSKSLLTIFKINDEDFDYILKENGINDYVHPDEIKSEKGKNIIVISLESIENTFLSKNFSNLTPNLQKLKKKWNYTKLSQNTGGGWTAGSLYTSLTGFPALFGITGNDIFNNNYDSKISSISHILKKAGYKLTFLNGNLEFAGVRHMLRALKFDQIIDRSFVKDTGMLSDYGIRDKDLFEIAKNEIELNSLEETNFALFISTTDTHFPNGIYDNRMEQYISKKNSDLEFAIASVDFLIADFLSFLESKNLIENTAIYIFPDHLKMGDPSILQNPDSRELFLINNSDFLKSSSQKKYQIDLPNLILDGAGVEHNVKFLTDYIIGDKELFIDENISFITEININGILKNVTRNSNPIKLTSNYNSYKKDVLRYIAHGGGKIDGFVYTNSLEALNENYKKGFRLFELDIIETKNNKYVAAHDWSHWASISGYKGNLPPKIETFLSHKIHEKYTPLDISAINQWFSNHKDAILVTDKVNDPVKFSEQFIDSSRLMMELFDMNSLKQGLKLNIKSAIPSQSIIQKLSKNEIINLKNMGVTDIAISRRFIMNNIDLLNEYKLNGINPYVYNINFDPGFDEEYVVKYEMDFIYGIYADDWSFK